LPPEERDVTSFYEAMNPRWRLLHEKRHLAGLGVLLRASARPPRPYDWPALEVGLLRTLLPKKLSLPSLPLGDAPVEWVILAGP
jgi:hypothetical protein